MGRTGTELTPEEALLVGELEVVPNSSDIIKDSSGSMDGLKFNRSATVAPTVTDDSASGYAIGSRWINKTAKKEYVALDVSVGAAVWNETTATGGIGDFLADGSVPMTGAIDETKGGDIASATTTDIGTATGNFVDITGTTTITGFGTVQAGVQRTLQFDAALILTHNGISLILPTAADITTVAGDTCDMISLGSGNWICTNYQRADGTALASAGGGGGMTLITTTNITSSVSSISFSSTIFSGGYKGYIIKGYIVPSGTENFRVNISSDNLSTLDTCSYVSGTSYSAGYLKQNSTGTTALPLERLDVLATNGILFEINTNESGGNLAANVTASYLQSTIPAITDTTYIGNGITWDSIKFNTLFGGTMDSGFISVYGITT